MWICDVNKWTQLRDLSNYVRTRTQYTHDVLFECVCSQLWLNYYTCAKMCYVPVFEHDFCVLKAFEIAQTRELYRCRHIKKSQRLCLQLSERESLAKKCISRAARLASLSVKRRRWCEGGAKGSEPRRWDWAPPLGSRLARCSRDSPSLAPNARRGSSLALHCNSICVLSLSMCVWFFLL